MTVRAEVPDFFLYGQPARPVELGFLHVETVMARRNIHHGHVGAHSHNELSQITFWTSGGGTYSIDDMQLDFRAPAASFVPSRVVHGFSVEPGSDAIVVSIANGALPALADFAGVAVHEPVFVQAGGPNWPTLEATMRLMLDAYRAGGETGAVLNGLAAAALAELERSRHRSAGEGDRDPLATRFRLLVEEEFRTQESVAHYAGRLATTPYLLNKACRQSFGRAPKELIVERRVLEAKRLLLFTIRSVETVAFEAGFRDPAYFSRAFKRATGMSPRAWRIGRFASTR